MTSSSKDKDPLRAKKACERAITVDEVPRRFDDACIQRLARLGELLKLAPNADMEVFANVLRNGLRRFARSARIPSANDVHQEIKALEQAAFRGKYEKVAELLERPSPAARAARDSLNEHLAAQMAWRGGVTFPDAAALRDPDHQGSACELVIQLCTCGRRAVEGRRRPTGKRSRSTPQPLLYGPTPSPHFPKRDAELDLVTDVQDAFLRAGVKPDKFAWTANPDFPGPFAQMTQEVLNLAGAAHADAVGLINALNRRRREMNPDWRKLLTEPLSTNNS